MPDDPRGQFQAIERMVETRHEVERVHRRPTFLSGPRWTRRRVIVSALIAVALAASGAAALVETRHDAADPAADAPRSPSAASSSAVPGASAAEVQAAQWILADIGPTHVVACDRTMCDLLSRDGVRSVVLLADATDIGGAEAAGVVVTTAASRRTLGAALAPITSPEPLAAFGSGNGEVEVTAVAMAGSDDYARRLLQDHGDRERVGSSLARNPRITLIDPGDADALANGMVDSRLCSLLALLSASHKITVASFEAPAPGAGSDVPTATMVISTIDGVSATGDSAQARALLTLLASQQAPYRPAAAVAETSGLRIAFAQPEPLGLITGAKP